MGGGGKSESEEWREGIAEREAIEAKRELNVEEWSNIDTHTQTKCGHTHTHTGWFQCEREHISHHPNTTIKPRQTPPLPPTTPSHQVSDSPLSNSCQITISQTRYPASCPPPPLPPFSPTSSTAIFHIVVQSSASSTSAFFSNLTLFSSSCVLSPCCSLVTIHHLLPLSNPSTVFP